MSPEFNLIEHLIHQHFENNPAREAALELSKHGFKEQDIVDLRKHGTSISEPILLAVQNELRNLLQCHNHNSKKISAEHIQHSELLTTTTNYITISTHIFMKLYNGDWDFEMNLIQRIMDWRNNGNSSQSTKYPRSNRRR